MKTAAIIGSQWGDEGKGKITDILAEEADFVVRYQGGNNAGHTVVVGSDVFKLHLIPSGVVHRKKCLIANGVVLDPRELVHEIDMFESRGISPDLAIDPLVSIILPYHNLLDGISEDSLKDSRIGTTKKGIGPAYEDKYARRGIRLVDMMDPDSFRKKLMDNFSLKKKIVENVYNREFSLSFEDVFAEYRKLALRLGKYMADVSLLVYENIDRKKILFESAQGTFLDVTYGTYPFVTSSHPVSGSIFPDVGIPPRKIDVIAVVKAYTTRVGSGPFLTELNDATGERIRASGNEFGTTTGRPRRCGWLDLVMLKYSARLNGFTELAITKLDVLSGIGKVRVATKYTMDGKEVGFPLTIEQLEKCEVHYREFDGFNIRRVKRYEELEDNARAYLSFIESYLDVPVNMVSVGPERGETIFRKPVWSAQLQH